MEAETLDTIIQIRVNGEQMARLEQISRETGLTRSQVVRHLIDNAAVRPALIRVDAIPSKADAAGSALARPEG